MSADTALALIGASLREIGVLAPGEAPSADDAEDALDTLNRMIDSEATERLQIYTTTRTEFTIRANVGEYLVGPVTDYSVVAADGFDTTWTALPPDWAVEFDAGTCSNETTIFQAGGHSVKLNVGGLGVETIYRDFVVFSNTSATVSIWLRGDGGGGTGAIVEVQCLETGNYLTSAGAWVGVETTLFTRTVASFALSTLTFTVENELVVGAQTATLRVRLHTDSFGPTGYFDTFSLTNVQPIVQIPRPIFIDRLNFLDTSVTPNVEMPLGMLTEDMWAALTMKDLTSPWPRSWYYNPTFPNGTLTLWPVPTSATIQGVIYVPTQVPKFQALSDTFSMPPGYEDMYVTGLAVRLCPSYKIEPSQFLLKRAADAAGLVKRANRRLAELTFPGGSLVGTRAGFTYDIKSDT